MRGTKLVFTVLEQGESWTPEYQDKPLKERWQDYMESLFAGEEVYSIKVLEVTEEEVDEPMPIELEEGEEVDDPDAE